ncbi:MAG: hypothetical protein DMF76_20495 [Acidobacteria bacterium]|nr:MAG: hypothetical protein DMF76_20495 [Acidobacteriota bacterium]
MDGVRYNQGLFVDHAQVKIPCTQIDSAVELHQRWPPFFNRKVGKANAFYVVAFGPPLLIIKSLDRAREACFEA